MDLRGWDERYRTEKGSQLKEPAPIVVQTASALIPGRALDLASGEGRNAIWLALHGWDVTAVDGSQAAIEILKQHAAERGLVIDSHVADLEGGEYSIEVERWDLIVISYYLQRDLFEPAKGGLRPGGILIAIVHIPEVGADPTRYSLRPGELISYFQDWETLHSYEGSPHDPEHRRRVAEIVTRRPRASPR